MKLIVRQQPEGYDADKASLMTDETGEMILLGCPQASKVAAKIAHRVNMYDSMLKVLTIFSSKEMGKMLIDVVTDNPPASAGPNDVKMVNERMNSLINAVDVILKGTELAKEREDAAAFEVIGNG